MFNLESSTTSHTSPSTSETTSTDNAEEQASVSVECPESNQKDGELEDTWIDVHNITTVSLFVGPPNTTVTDTPQSVSGFDNDIGKLVQSHQDLNQLSGDIKYRVLTTEPDGNPLSYPRTRPSNSAPYRQFQPSWLKQYPWLHYSRHDDGMYC